MNAELLQVLRSLKGECFCEVGIGNPMFQGRHSTTCITAMRVLTEAEAAEREGREGNELQYFQERCRVWADECFGHDVAYDAVERNHRFLEEALELVQSLGCSEAETLRVVDYVYRRPVGEPLQEVGGVMVTLGVLCNARALRLSEATWEEMARIWVKIETVRAKHFAKPKMV